MDEHRLGSNPEYGAGQRRSSFGSGRDALGWRSLHRRTFWDSHLSGPDGVTSRVPLARYWWVLVIPLIAGAVVLAVWLLGGEKKDPALAQSTAVVESTKVAISPTAARTVATAASQTSPVEQSPVATIVPSLGVNSDVRVGGTDGAGVSLRTGAGLSFDKLSVLPDGTQLKIVGGPQERDGYQWWQVEGEGIAGWVAGDVLILAR